MTNSLAAILAVLIAAALVVDLVMGWQVHVFLGRKLLDLTEYIAFWR